MLLLLGNSRNAETTALRSTKVCRTEHVNLPQQPARCFGGDTNASGLSLCPQMPALARASQSCGMTKSGWELWLCKSRSRRTRDDQPNGKLGLCCRPSVSASCESHRHKRRLPTAVKKNRCLKRTHFSIFGCHFLEIPPPTFRPWESDSRSVEKKAGFADRVIRADSGYPYIHTLLRARMLVCSFTVLHLDCLY